MKQDDILSAASAAQKAVTDIPTEFRGHAFQVVFEKLLASDNVASGTTPTPKQVVSSGKHGEQAGVVEAVLSSDIDFSEFDKYINNGSWLERSLIVLYMVEQQLGARSLTPPEIARILKEKLRIPSVYAPNINRAISTKMSHFVRSPEGQAYRYSLSSLGLNKVKSMIERE
ncbi:MAG: hypothetical protein KIT08_10500 [Anaerolineales bacterium]|nr:MAG: hypothetical protein KIT08_10500 [Anaerolineales bacterium]